MRILAIRGANLASLEGAFEVPLDDGPLARAGVFAICGPTGAGKSTLLDAMCLALFDSVPRLAGGRRARYGRPEEEGGDRLTVADPRSLLRRGAGRGYAEVDFRGVDGRDYRARWEVRRARHRADGRLQPSAMSLRDLAEDRLVGHLKTEVRSEVEARLGLTFDQFRRSVLLAQGDFATFLEADAKSRADLLERMTGTEIYGRISAEAFARAGRERRSLQVRIAERDAIPVLSDEARAALEGRVPGLELAAAEADLAHRNAAEAVRWYGVLSGLTQEERQAEEALAQLRRQLALAETRRRELEAIEAAQPLRPALEAAEQARAAARRAAEAHDAAATRVKAAGVALAEAEDRARAAALTLAAARASEREAQPTLEAVRDLERDLARERRRRAAATTAADRATRARREVEA
ncbi:MAG: AAA family ATPase, partial [Sandaracinaceae bacterium]